MASFAPFITEASRRFGVPENVINATVGTESAGDPNAVSPKGAAGLMQVMPATYAQLQQQHGITGPATDPRSNILAGTAYLKQMYDRFGNWKDALGGYNAGPGAYAKVLAGTMNAPAETAAYIPKVLARAGLLGNAAGSDINGVVTRAQALRGVPDASQSPAAPPQQDQPMPPLPSLLGDAVAPDQPQQTPQGLLGMDVPPVNPLSYMLSGASQALAPLMGYTNRPTNWQQGVAALGGGIGGGQIEARQAQLQDAYRQSQMRQMNVQNQLSQGQLQAQRRTQAQSDRLLAAAPQYADQLEKSGHAELAQALRANPSLMEDIVKGEVTNEFQKGKDRYKLVGNDLVDTTNMQRVYSGQPDAPAGVFDSKSLPGQAWNILLSEKSDPNSPAYATAWNIVSQPKPEMVTDPRDGSVKMTLMSTTIPPGIRRPGGQQTAAAPAPAPGQDTVPNPVAPGAPAPAAPPGVQTVGSTTFTDVPGAGKAPKFNKEELDASGYAARIANVTKTLADLEKSGFVGPNGWQNALAAVPGSNMVQSENFQRFDQGKRDFINAVLRRESGAAIAPSEFESANKQYFPEPGDGPKVLEQKRTARQQALSNMVSSSGGAYEYNQKNPPGGTPAAPAQPAGGKAAPAEMLADAKAAIAKGAPRDAVIKRLKELGFTEEGI